jgi:hypothetical protein
MANPTNQQKAPRNEINGSHRVSTNGSWTIIEKEPLPQDKFSRQLSSQKVFKSATMPLLGKWSTNNTTISNKLSNIYSGQESATNGLSVLGKAWSYFFGKSATPTAKPTISTSRENPAKGDEADMSDPLVCARIFVEFAISNALDRSHSRLTLKSSLNIRNHHLELVEGGKPYELCWIPAVQQVIGYLSRRFMI